jgi:16S rRNA C967 or C1407 C5-methylase (RsmB/RsmF family)
MGGVPAYAAVSQSVELAKARGAPGAAGFVNGVLQSLRRRGHRSTFPAFETDPVGAPVHVGLAPALARGALDRAVRRGRYARLVEANNRRPELYLRVLGDRA